MKKIALLALCCLLLLNTMPVNVFAEQVVADATAVPTGAAVPAATATSTEADAPTATAAST